jgi:hypothetical protein
MPPARQRNTPKHASGKAESVGVIENKRTGMKDAKPEQHTVYPPRPTDGTQVEVELGFTENLGEFNFGKVHVRVSMPCTADTIVDAGNAAYTNADQLLTDYRDRFINPQG